eukprot:TRINITY_DN7481_c1_g1_i3.p3 TRINITY_DN7481_c1_g1~~TRINITY_DN7481_c1_g1_i3.p3  ORF type:complete len:131 (+),score=12.09 TRINITY_DN7481_c1_g1_i3:467-859(+)
MMVLGGSFALLASVVWLPRFMLLEFWGHSLSIWGTSWFRTGSVFYLMGSCSSLPGAQHALRAALAARRGRGASISILVAIYAYIAGALLFILGGAFSQTDTAGFVQTWITGSSCFVTGSTLLLMVACGVC